MVDTLGGRLSERLKASGKLGLRGNYSQELIRNYSQELDLDLLEKLGLRGSVA